MMLPKTFFLILVTLVDIHQLLYHELFSILLLMSEAATGGVLKYFVIFTGKHWCQSLFFNKVASLTPTTLLKKGLWRRCFLVNFAKFSRTPF